MLILFVRLVFVLACLVVGQRAGHYFYADLFDGEMPDWFGLPLGFSVAITLIALEYAFRRHFTRSLVAVLLGLAAGLGISALATIVLHSTIQDEVLADNLDAPVALVLTYLVMISVIAHADRFRLILPFVEFRPDHLELGALVVDASALRDSRLLSLIRSGIVGQRLILHRDLITFIEQQAISEDTVEQAQGRRALENLADLRGLGTVRVDIDHTEIPNARTFHELLVGLARLEGARVLTNNPELAARARGEDLGVIELNELGAVFAPSIRVGETISVSLEKQGEEADQAIGHLDDGSLVIVAGASSFVGRRVEATILRTHQSANGRMIFAERPNLRRESTAELIDPV
ncbi:MAG: TRAM domain-containing protein [Planctomycetota bacterium]